MRSATKEFIRQAEERSRSLTDLVLFSDKENILYDVEGGSCTGTSLYQESAISIQNIHMEEGTIFPDHKHEETEILIIYKGKVQFISDEIGTQTLGPSQFVRIPKGVMHKCYAIEDTYLIGVTIPKGKGYPDGR